ncbi:putative DNA binding protein 14 [Elsinoe australis]|uniref:Putative DNA binding protein 14 n=1 Tax=Elsinoe australis TaxID=40998 RepID=A0A4U7AP74_9PEZI|nr:putative DNA binding protein 14 [Elsinoe australis]
MPRQPEDSLGDSEPTELEDDSDDAMDQLNMDFLNEQTYGLENEGKVHNQQLAHNGLPPLPNFHANTDGQREDDTAVNSDITYATADDAPSTVHNQGHASFDQLGRRPILALNVLPSELDSQPAPRHSEVQMSAEDYAKMATQTLETVQSRAMGQHTRLVPNHKHGAIARLDEGPTITLSKAIRGPSLQSPIHLNGADINLEEYDMPADGGASLLEEDEQHFAKLSAQGKRLSLEDQAYYATLRSYLAAKAEDDRKKREKTPTRRSVEFAGIKKPKDGRKKGRGRGGSSKKSKRSSPEIVSGEGPVMDEANEGAEFADDESTPTLETTTQDDTTGGPEKKNLRPRREKKHDTYNMQKLTAQASGYEGTRATKSSQPNTKHGHHSTSLASSMRGRGRPKKSLLADEIIVNMSGHKGRGRPKKSLLTTGDASDMAGHRRSGRVSKSTSPAPDSIKRGIGKHGKSKRGSYKPAKYPVMLYSGSTRAASTRPSVGDVIKRDSGVARKKGLRTWTTLAKRACQL